VRLLGRTTPDIPPGREGASRESVATLQMPPIGGIPQGVLVRGRDRGNPGLLILHGGPGGAYIGCARSWFGFLERQWVVVNWDMRGAGLSYSPRLDPSTLNGEQLGRDAGEVREWVRRRFGVDRWSLLAHSFGTRVAPLVLHRDPGAFESYFAVSPAPTDPLAETESYEWTLARARKERVRRAVRDLERTGPPPYRAAIGGLDMRAKWTDRLGGAIEGSTGADLAFRALRFGSEYTWGDLFRRLLPGVRFWMRNPDESLGPDAPGDAAWDIPVPLTVISGSVDWMAPLSASRRTFDRARAPRKSFVDLDGIGHYPFVQAPDRFAAALTR
jgi:pimeloyl-ACP methyl ester carboxylesterase